VTVEIEALGFSSIECNFYFIFLPVSYFFIIYSPLPALALAALAERGPAAIFGFI
jgi:hypothetical protein